jgi:thymidine phosphorylase
VRALAIGQAALHLGAGRRAKDDPVDHAVGIVSLAKRGDRVEQGQALAEVHARNSTDADAVEAEAAAAYELSAEPPAPTPIVLDVLS